MSLDLVANPARLRILTALAGEEAQEFVQLRRATSLTDGNLCTHARRLSAAGFVVVDKSFRDGKPVTRFQLTRSGRLALESHANELMNALGMTARVAAVEQSAPLEVDTLVADDWID